jgi:hypothetical protein
MERIEDETVQWMISGGVFGVVDYCHLRTLLKAGCTPARFSVIGFLIESNKLIFDNRYSLSQMRSTSAPHSVVCYNTNRGEPIKDQCALSAVLDNEGHCTERSEAPIECSIGPMLHVAYITQKGYAHCKKAYGAEPKLRLER